MTTKAQQSALDNALVSPENQRVIDKCNMRINLGMKPKEPTYQVVLDSLALTTCYPAFLITAEVLVIYMHQLWATINKHNASYRFKIDNKRFFMNVEVFREILNICPRILGQEFDELSSEEEALSFIHELGHSGEIKYITDVIVDHLHQPWRTFASIINKCLCRKELAYQIDNKDSKKQDKMFYPRFTKIIIHHFLKKDKSISMRNRTFMHTARDDSLLGTMRFVSRHEDTQMMEVKDDGDDSDGNNNDDDGYDNDNDDNDDNDSDHERTKLHRDKNPNLNQFAEEHEEEEEEDKQVDQYAQAISSIPVIVDRYINKLGEVIHKAIQSHNEECREEAQAEKHEYIDLVDMLVRTIIRDEVKTQLPQILPKAVSDFATPVIERNVTESLEDVVLARSSSQPKSTYKAAASLSEYELTKILLDKMEEIDESRVQKNQEFDTGNNDEKPKDGAAPKNDWFKKPKRPLTPDPDWNKRQQVDFRTPQT
ncbi:hypothetical protein Tco_1122763 [Tanacetum coccineum]|uniref:Uncharacterized protein n=1 Tax=Tanacetum coccineum TaxID=301880 RepID=A0ABQ5J4E1_9ASTR